VAFAACRDLSDRASICEPREKPVEVITSEVLDRELARLETDLGITDAATNG